MRERFSVLPWDSSALSYCSCRVRRQALGRFDDVGIDIAGYDDDANDCSDDFVGGEIDIDESSPFFFPLFFSFPFFLVFVGVSTGMIFPFVTDTTSSMKTTVMSIVFYRHQSCKV